MMYNEFKQKQALLMGGSSGIGQAIAEILLIEGAIVTLIGRDPNKLQAAESTSQCIGRTIDELARTLSKSPR